MPMTHERFEARSTGDRLKPRAILFDLDDTLLDRDASVLSFVQEQHRCFAVSLAHIPGEAYVRRVVELDAPRYVGRQAVYRDVAREFGLPATLAQELVAGNVLLTGSGWKGGRTRSSHHDPTRQRSVDGAEESTEEADYVTAGSRGAGGERTAHAAAVGASAGGGRPCPLHRTASHSYRRGGW